MFVFSYTVSQMAQMIGNLNAKSKEFQNMLDRCLEFLRDKDIPIELQVTAPESSLHRPFMKHVENSGFADVG